MKVHSILFALFMVATIAVAHGGHKHISGTVVSVDKATIVVKASSGNVSVPLSSTTKYYRGSGTKLPADATEVTSGMRVVVHLGSDGKAVEVHIPRRR